MPDLTVANGVTHFFFNRRPHSVEFKFWADSTSANVGTRHVVIQDGAEIEAIGRVFEASNRLASEPDPLVKPAGSSPLIAGFDVEVNGGHGSGADWGFSDSWAHLDSMWGPEVKAMLEKYRAKSVPTP